MDELTRQPAVKAGIDDALAAKTVGITRGFRRQQGPADNVGSPIRASDIQTIARELFRFGRDRSGADRTIKIIAGTPGLNKFA